MKKASGRKSYVLVGSGSRSEMFIKAATQTYKDIAELKALCDVNQTRMDFHNAIIEKSGAKRVPTYKASDFDRMIEEQRPDFVIVTSVDRTHHQYICRAMELGCDVISEKPMTVDLEKCQRIIDTKKATGRELRVTFNYRYAPRATKIKEVLKSGLVGKVMSVHFEWLLDTRHGTDYFRRWHRDKRNSGGLLVHKSTHHFDLVNWWLDSAPERVMAMGGLRFYGKANAEERGVTEFYPRCRGSEAAAKDPFGIKITEKDENLMGLYYKAEHEDGYFRDLSVFSDGISIEDTLGLLVSYKSKAVMTYSLNAHCPWEGFRVMFNGTKGRLECNVVERPFVCADVQEDMNHFGMRELEGDRKAAVPEIVFQPHWGKPMSIPYQASAGGHGGGDDKLLSDIFAGVKDNSLGHSAGYVDGAMSILTGIAGNMSLASGLPVDVGPLVKF